MKKKLSQVFICFVVLFVAFSTVYFVSAEDKEMVDVSAHIISVDDQQFQVEIKSSLKNMTEQSMTSLTMQLPQEVKVIDSGDFKEVNNDLVVNDIDQQEELKTEYDCILSFDRENDSSSISWLMNGEEIKKISCIQDILDKDDLEKIKIESKESKISHQKQETTQKEVSLKKKSLQITGDIITVSSFEDFKYFFTGYSKSERDGKTLKLDNHIEVPETGGFWVEQNVTLDLNGYTISIIGDTNASLLKVVSNGSLTIVDSNSHHENKKTINYKKMTVNEQSKPVTEKVSYSGGYITGHKRTLFEVEGNGKLNLTGSCLYNNGTYNDGYDGGAIRLLGDAQLHLNDNALLIGNKGSYGGAINAGGNSQIIINDAVLSGNQAYRRGGAIYAVNQTKVTLQNGYITCNEANSGSDKGVGDGGGGIRLQDNTSLIMENGYVTGNISEVGGGAGIRAGWYDYDGNGPIHHVNIAIRGGYISGNTSGNEGAGMSVGSGCHADITSASHKIYITYNRVNKTEDWGGGGLFCANDGTMHITHLLVENNQAGGFGGGVAGCSTGRVFDYNNDHSGAAIFNNFAQGQNLSGGSSSKNEDHAYTEGNSVFHNSGYQDYFCALNSVIDNKMLGGGFERWTGSSDNQKVNAQTQNKMIDSTFLLGLTAHPTDLEKANAKSESQVIVSHNYSYTHGGGILCNGYLVVGSIPQTLEIGDRLLLSTMKKVEGANHIENKFKFNLLDSDKNVVSTMTSIDSDQPTEGMINIAIPFKAVQQSPQLEQHVYYLVEDGSGIKDYITDSTVYKITIHGNMQSEANVMGADVQKSVITDVKIEKGQFTQAGEFAGQTIEIEKNLNTGSNHAKLVTIPEYGFVNKYIPTKVLINKVDGQGKAVVGAKLSLLDGQGHKVLSFTSTKKAYEVTGKLEAGKTYVLHEEQAPKGYEKAKDVKFTVLGDGKITKVKMIDIKKPEIYVAGTKLVLYKTDQDKNLITGATFKLVKLENNVEKTIDTQSNGPKYEFKNLGDGIYRIYEVKAPNGYNGLTTYFEIEIKDGKIYFDGQLEDSFTVINTNDGTTPEVLGDEIDEGDYNDWVQEQKNRHSVNTSDNQYLYEYSIIAMVTLLGIVLLNRKSKRV